MGDQPPGGDLSTSQTPPPPQNMNTQRTFFSSDSSVEFFDHLRTVLDEHHAQTLMAQEALFTRFNTPILTLVSTVKRVISAIPGLQPPPTGNVLSTGNSAHRQPPPVPTRPPSERPPSSPQGSRQHSPPPPVPPRKTTTFTLTTAEMTVSGLGESSSGIKLPSFHGKDRENMIAWLHQAEWFFKLKNTADERKVDLISFSLEGDAQSFFHYCFIRNNEIELTWDEFKHAFRQKYEVPRCGPPFCTTNSKLCDTVVPAHA